MREGGGRGRLRVVGEEHGERRGEEGGEGGEERAVGRVEEGEAEAGEGAGAGGVIGGVRGVAGRGGEEGGDVLLELVMGVGGARVLHCQTVRRAALHSLPGEGKGGTKQRSGAWPPGRRESPLSFGRLLF